MFEDQVALESRQGYRSGHVLLNGINLAIGLSLEDITIVETLCNKVVFWE